MKSNKTAYEAAMHLLKYRDQSTYELRNKLKIRKYSSEEIEECIHRLLECGYVDDKVLAEETFRNYKNMNVYGDSYIHLKMRSRGLITDEHLSHSEEMAAALNVMRSKIKLVSALKKDYKRSAALLYRRGFDTSVICSVLEELHISDYE